MKKAEIWDSNQVGREKSAERGGPKVRILGFFVE
jgi:hypothetical protein